MTSQTEPDRPGGEAGALIQAGCSRALALGRPGAEFPRGACQGSFRPHCKAEMDRNGDCLGSQWLSPGVAGPEAGSSTSGLYEKGGGCKETRWKHHPHCLVQDTPRYLALPLCAIICPFGARSAKSSAALLVLSLGQRQRLLVSFPKQGRDQRKQPVNDTEDLSAQL